MNDIALLIQSNVYARAVACVIGIMAVFNFHAVIAVWLERKISARMHLRLGPTEVGPFGLLQSLADAVKLLGKEIITPGGVDRKLYLLAPFVVLFPSLLMFVVIPFSDGLVVQDLDIGILYFFSVASMSTLGIFMAGWSSNNKYSLLGAMRSIAQSIAYEIPIILSILTIVFITQSLKLSDIVKYQQEHLWFAIPQFIAFLVYVTSAIAELNRTPFDMPEAESELVAGFHTEYSGMQFAIYFMAEYANMFLVSAMATTLFLGGWSGPLLPGVLWFFIKVYALVFFIIWVRFSFPRMRPDQLLGFCWKFLIPVALANLLITSLVIQL